jgi:hypothetical protein
MTTRASGVDTNSTLAKTLSLVSILRGCVLLISSLTPCRKYSEQVLEEHSTTKGRGTMECLACIPPLLRLCGRRMVRIQPTQ